MTSVVGEDTGVDGADAGVGVDADLAEPAAPAVEARRRAPTIQNTPAIPALPTSRPPEEAAWLAGLAKDKRGKLKTTYANVVAVLREDSDFGRFSFNERTLQPEFNRRPLDEGLMLRLAETIELRWSVTPGFEMFVRAVMCVARENAYDPVYNELNGLVWDGVPRLDAVASKHLRNSGELEAVLVRKTIIAAVVRALEPGCQVDTTCVLTGGQGALKSSFWRALAGSENFGDSALDITNKDAPLQMRASWFYELPEIDGITTRRHADQVKAFMTVRSDLFRPPYGRAVARYPRATVFVGSTNKDDYLTDPTGSRRFWTVEVNADLPEHERPHAKINVEALAAERDQLLAEAVEAYRSWCARGRPRGECLWWLTRAEDDALAEQSLKHQESDIWEGPISKWLEGQYGPRDAMEILSGALQVEKAKATRADQTRVGRIMHALGYRVERSWNAGLRRRVYVRDEAQAHTSHDRPSESVTDADSSVEANDDDDQRPHGQSNRSNMPHGEVGLVSPHSRPGQSNQSNQSNQFPYVGAHAPALARAHAPVSVGLVGLVGLDCKSGRETSPTSSLEVGLKADRLDCAPETTDAYTFNDMHAEEEDR